MLYLGRSSGCPGAADPEGLEVCISAPGSSVKHYSRGTNGCETCNKWLEDLLSAPHYAADTAQCLLRLFVTGYNLRIGTRKLGQPEVPISDLKLACEVLP